MDATMESAPSQESAPSSMAGVAPPGLGAMSIEQMFQQIMAQGEETNRSVAKLGREQSEVKQLASKVYSTVTVVQTDLAALTARVDALEKNLKSSSGSSDSANPRSVMRETPYSSGNRWEGLGGQKGSLMIFGGFPAWSKTETIQKILENDVFAHLQPEVLAKIDQTTLKIPGPRGHIALVDIHLLESPKSTRTALMATVKEIRGVLSHLPECSGSTSRIWVSASKPPEHRRQDKEVTEVIQIFRKLFQVTAEKDERLEADYSKGRVFWIGKLVAHRRADVQGLQFRMEVLKQIDATITSERLEDLRQTVKKEREAKMDQM